MKKIEVVAAIIQHEEKTLCVQRGPAIYEYIEFKFEFPCGKVEPNETNKIALILELKEELHLSLDISQMQYFMIIKHNYPDFHITMHGFLCPVHSQNINLTEHIDAKWLTLAQLSHLDLAEVDISLIKKLMKKFS